MLAIHEGKQPPELEIGGDALEFEDNRQSDADDEYGTLITVDDDLQIPDIDLKALPYPSSGKCSQPKDISHMDKWLLQWELKTIGATLEVVDKK